MTVRGKVGEEGMVGAEVSPEEAELLARNAGLRLLSTLSHYLDGDLDRVDQVRYFRRHTAGSTRHAKTTDHGATTALAFAPPDLNHHPPSFANPARGWWSDGARRRGTTQTCRFVSAAFQPHTAPPHQVIKVVGIVNGTPDFRGHGKVRKFTSAYNSQLEQWASSRKPFETQFNTIPAHACAAPAGQVINGCSDVLVEVLGDRGRHARTCTGSGSLPAAVTCEMVVRCKWPKGPSYRDER